MGKDKGFVNVYNDHSLLEQLSDNIIFEVTSKCLRQRRPWRC
ncbi:hypothetical protein Desor_2217 [Desulfosporosinus orientis DSM 765]|uniref:Uncharacterized protein n=1 Tax=Desulfosporosinus orientis (strain ATCC 19365 / DSM 765 / NCIMB 8382 / VKM B-1628 / Singapore I) TaxID=768706 RepID=G7W8V9_DESOD|nr:hypothetical protein Desor_2217 [Desulfosporosinus orientis DSM 765]